MSRLLSFLLVGLFMTAHAALPGIALRVDGLTGVGGELEFPSGGYHSWGAAVGERGYALFTRYYPGGGLSGLYSGTRFVLVRAPVEEVRFGLTGGGRLSFPPFSLRAEFGMMWRLSSSAGEAPLFVPLWGVSLELGPF